MKPLQEAAITATPEPGLFFVVGVWRSGTSLLHASLQRHPQVALMYEAAPFGLWPRNPDAIWPADWPKRLEFYNQTISRHHLMAAALPSPAPAREAALSLYSAFAAQRGATIIGEKAPAYHTCITGIASVFPEARFLVIWRDPLECCRSAVRAGRKDRFFSQRGMTTRTLFGAEKLARGVEWLQQNGRPVHEILYSEFVASPEGHLRRICEFAGIPFDPRMLDLKSADHSLLPAGEHHDQVRSGRIEPAAGGDDLLPPAFSSKARRYAARWRGQFPHLGFCRAVRPEAGEKTPGLGERSIDHVVSLMWRVFDSLKVMVFRRIPLGWWGRLRSATPRVREESAGPDGQGQAGAAEPRGASD
jgi:hypothetical protein